MGDEIKKQAITKDVDDKIGNGFCDQGQYILDSRHLKEMTFKVEIGSVH